MTHDSAVRTIVSLLPEIEKKGAEAVLLDYAEGDNMPPAQLEKLAQVFNTLRTLDHIDKQASADRGKAVNLVDVPQLVVDYISRTKQETSAAPIASRVSTHNPTTVDLMSAVRFDAPQVKAASAPEAPVAKRFTKKEVESLAIELEMDARFAMEKIANELLTKLPKMSDGSVDISGALSDARPHCSDEVLKKAIGWLKTASTAPLIGDKMDAPLTKRAFAMTGECGKLLVDFNYEFAARELMRKLAAQVDENLPATQETADDIAREVENLLRENNIDIGDEEPTRRPEFVTERGAEKVDHSKDNGQSRSTPPTPPSSHSSVSKVLQAIGTPIRAVGNAVGQAEIATKSHIDRVTGKERFNHDQLRSDIDVEDVRRAIGIRRMIGTDPVLRESDPREVLEIYNAIARTNPEIVTNMPALRLLLREAVSYEGLTLDSQKQLTDIRQNSSKSEAQEVENLKRRYTIGGGTKSKSN
jgi:hypothetical protein